MRKLGLTALAAVCSTLAPAHALEVTANGGYMTEYIFRGVPQDDSSANGGLDVTHGGFYAGTWGADVGQGLEIDVYGGYGGNLGDLSYGVGATGYFYTDDFDDTYREINLSAGYRWFSVAAAIGEYDNFDGPTADYTYIAPRIDYRGLYALAGLFRRDFDGEYYEAGYAGNFEPIDLDYTFSFIYSTDDLLGGDDDSSVVISVRKTFSLSD